MFLNFSGKESLNWNYFDLSVVDPEPYHYFEAWFIAFVAKFTGLNYHKVNILICLPIFNTLSFLGILSILRLLNIKTLYKVFGFLIVFISGFYFLNGYGIDYFYYADKYAYNAIDHPWCLKLSVLYFIYLNSFYFILTNRTLIGLFFLALLPVFNVVTAPTIALVFATIFIIYICTNNKTLRANLDKMKFLFFISICFVFAYIFLFYSAFNSSQINVVSELSILDLISEIFSFSRAIIVAEQFIYILLLYAPFIFMLTCIIRSKLKNERYNNLKLKHLISICFFVIMYSFVVSQILWNEFTGSHFWFLNMIPILNIGCFLILIYFLDRIMYPRYKVMSFIIISLLAIIFVGRSAYSFNRERHVFVNGYDEEFLTEILNNIDVFTGNGVLLEDIKNYDLYGLGAQYNPFVFPNATLPQLYGLSSDLHMFSLNYHELNNINSELKWKKNFYLKDPYVSYLLRNNVKNLSEPNDSLRLNFIKENEINFIISTNGVIIDQIFQPLVSKEIINPMDNSKVYILKK